MKDEFLLLATGLVASGLAWAFWSYLGQHAFEVLTTVFVLTLAADNVRLRRKIRQSEQK